MNGRRFRFEIKPRVKQGKCTKAQRLLLDEILSKVRLERCSYEFNSHQKTYLEQWVEKPLLKLIASFDGLLTEGDNE